jgi:hypothetical protein
MLGLKLGCPKKPMSTTGLPQKIQKNSTLQPYSPFNDTLEFSRPNAAPAAGYTARPAAGPDETVSGYRAAVLHSNTSTGPATAARCRSSPTLVHRLRRKVQAAW